jgi:two-component system chemotaxis sensor kinase CheA
VTPQVLPPAAEATPEPPAAPALLAPSHYVRVDLARLDELMRMIGDLVISRARLGESLTRLETHVPAVLMRSVQENALALERQLRDLREGVMRVRLVPVGEIFRRMPFVVRDLARETGKQVELEMRGQDTEIDKFLIERMLDPVLHLVRNAVSHGIESADERRAAGKPAVARITLSAASVGDLVMLEIVDDGRGVDAEKVAARARAQGLDVPAGPLDAHGLLNILCAPGFSTRDEADRASGRGVGMAVVQTAVQELGGKLSLDSTPGQGSRFVVELPVTLAITDAIIAQVGPQTFALPQSSVREVIEVDPSTIKRFEQNEIAPYRDGVLPIVRLADRFGLQSQARRSLHVFVIGHGQSAVGLAVDRIVGQREVVVRTLADALVKVDGVVGATDLGDGRVVLILDAARLAARTRTRRPERAAARLRP